VQVVLVAEAITSSLNDTGFFVEAFNDAEGDFVLRPTVHRDTVPMAIDELPEVLERLQALPTQRGPPLLVALSRPRLTLMRPRLGGLFERVPRSLPTPSDWQGSCAAQNAGDGDEAVSAYNTVSNSVARDAEH
jgi:hypothetical protein